MSRQAWGMASALDQASGTIMVLTAGKLRPPRTKSSNTLSSAAESEPAAWITGFRSSMASPKTGEAMRVSWLFIQLTLPLSVLISPLWARMRKG